MKKPILISLIFLLSFCLFACLLPKSHGATSVEVLTYYQNLQPVYGEWFYEGRNAHEDFQIYLDGSSPNLTVVGTEASDTMNGIFTVNGSVYRDIFYMDQANNPLLTFQRPSDKNYLLCPNTTAISDDYVDISIVNNTAHTFGMVEYMFYYVRFIDFDAGTTASIALGTPGTPYIFHLYFNWDDPNKDVLVGYYDAGVVYWAVIDMDYYAPGRFYWALIHVYMEYTFNGQAYVHLNDTDIFDTEKTFPAWTDLGGSYYTEMQLRVQTNAQDGMAISLVCVDGSFLRSGYNAWDMQEYVQKSLITNNVEDVFSFSIPQANQTMESHYISKLEIESEESQDSFVSFLVDVTGNTGQTETLDYIDAYVEIPSNVYNGNITHLIINTRYRCSSTNFFNNTIRLRVTRVFVPKAPEFMDLLLLAIPSTIMLIVPSAAAYTRFKKNGFLAVFFIMTLILTISQMIPAGIGLIMVVIEIIIFLKIMQMDRVNQEEY